MSPCKFLPADYAPLGSLNLAKNKSLQLGLSLGSLVLFVVFGYLFFYAAVLLVPAMGVGGKLALGLSELLSVLGGLIIVFVLVLVMHELVHGIFFWLFTRERPIFAFKGIYAYAAAPDWYMPRIPFLIVGLAPVCLLTVLGLILLPLLPLNIALFVVFALTINAAGAVGDLYIVFRLLFIPATCLVRDEGDSITWYAPGCKGA